MVPSHEKTTAISLDALVSFCERALTTVGILSSAAKTTATPLVTTDSWGIFTHGCRPMSHTHSSI